MSDFARLLGGISDAMGGRMVKLARTELEGLIVSTIHSSDQGPETAICDSDGAHPVERYATDALALLGHEKWCAFVKEGKREITELGYGDIVDPTPLILTP